MAAWDSTRGPRWWQVWLGWLRPLQGALKIADGILESMGRAGLPGVGVIEEFKNPRRLARCRRRARADQPGRVLAAETVPKGANVMAPFAGGRCALFAHP
jgi:hypothetical protein